jgi:hypothetical protein
VNCNEQTIILNSKQIHKKMRDDKKKTSKEQVKTFLTHSTQTTTNLTEDFFVDEQIKIMKIHLKRSV